MSWFDIFDSEGHVNPGKTPDDIRKQARDDQLAGTERTMGWNTTADERNTYWDINPPSPPNQKW